MKTLGLLGGMSWESTIPYYRTINQVVGRRLGGLHSAKILLHSFDFEPIEQLQHSGRWDACGALLRDAAQGLQRAGADGLLICTNTMHRVADEVEAGVSIPLLHIADATAEAIASHGVRRVGLLGTRFTMEEAFYRGRLEERFGLEIQIPESQDRELVHRVIYDELCRGRIEEASRGEYVRIVNGLVNKGCQGVVLGCTEIGLLLRPGDATVPLFDTAAIHAEAAARWALDGASDD